MANGDIGGNLMQAAVQAAVQAGFPPLGRIISNSWTKLRVRFGQPRERILQSLEDSNPSSAENDPAASCSPDSWPFVAIAGVCTEILFDRESEHVGVVNILYRDSCEPQFRPVNIHIWKGGAINDADSKKILSVETCGNICAPITDICLSMEGCSRVEERRACRGWRE